jgi:hypothetical protein
MSLVTRRQLLQYGTALTFGSVLPVCITSTAVASPALVALAIASIVANMIASNNRRNVDAYMLIAIREELRVATAQLASLQAAVAALLQDFAELRKDIEDLLWKQSVREKQADIRVNVDLYLSEINTRHEYKSNEDWFNSSRREETLNRLLYDLKKARLSLWESSAPIDPSAAIVLSSAALVEINLMNICNTKQKVYDAITVLDAIKWYEEYFETVTKVGVGRSAAWYLAQHIASRQGLLQWLKTNPRSAPLGNDASSFKCAQVVVRYEYCCRGEIDRIYQTVRYEDVNALDL